MSRNINDVNANSCLQRRIMPADEEGNIALLKDALNGCYIPEFQEGANKVMAMLLDIRDKHGNNKKVEVA